MTPNLRRSKSRRWPAEDVAVVLGDDAQARARPRYELGRLIGRGGMGEVFAAYDAQIGREVAIKRLHAGTLTVDARERFLHEARIQGWLDHPAIPAVYELGSDERGRPFFVMKRVSGMTLADLLAARATSYATAVFSERQLLRAFVEICLAIEFAHTRGVLHRDLKPANMLLGDFGEVYVLDWGIARVLDESLAVSDVTRHTLPGGATIGALGTPGYMPPEQIRGDDVDRRADVYALGCVLYEILVGQRLHPEGLAGMTCALAGITAVPSTLRPEVAPELDQLCRWATAADRTERLGSARALADAVQRYLDGDRDLSRRRDLAHAHLDAARRATTESADPTLALREAGRALVLDPGMPEAAELVGRLMIQPTTTMPAAVAQEVEQVAKQEHVRKAKVIVGVHLGYACLAPLLCAFGIRDVPYLTALVVIAGLNIALAHHIIRRGRATRTTHVLVALGQAAMFALIARMFTPLFVAPGLAAVTLMSYAHHPATHRREMLAASLLAIAAILAVWGAELAGWISATTLVHGGSVTLVPPLEGLAGFPIVPALGCYLVLLVGVAVEVAYAGARRGREARSELHVQAWQLRQLVSLEPLRSRIS